MNNHEASLAVNRSKPQKGVVADGIGFPTPHGGPRIFRPPNRLFAPRAGSGKGRYSPAECTGIREEWIAGNPDPKYVSTSEAERNTSIFGCIRVVEAAQSRTSPENPLAHHQSRPGRANKWFSGR